MENTPFSITSTKRTKVSKTYPLNIVFSPLPVVSLLKQSEIQPKQQQQIYISGRKNWFVDNRHETIS